MRTIKMISNIKYFLVIYLVCYGGNLAAEDPRYAFTVVENYSSSESANTRLIYTQSDTLGGLNATYVVVMPTEVCINQPFDILYSIRNNTGLQYFPALWADLIPFNQGVNFVTSSVPSTGTFNPGASQLIPGDGGTGAWQGPTGLNNLRIDGNTVANLRVTLVATNTGVAFPTGPIWSSAYKANPPIPFGTFAIEVVDAAPSAALITVTGCDNTPLNISVLDGASACSPFILTGVSGPSTNGGFVEIELNGTVTYIPATGFTGADSFIYTIQDSSGNIATGPVSILVLPCTPQAICSVSID